LKLGCVEEIAWRHGWISDSDLVTLAEPLLGSGYGTYLLDLIDNSK
jgi:glucose-1-phosphate thymidylyltransferase